MRAVAVGFVLRMLALAKESGFGFLGLENDWGHAVFLVGPVTEGLAFRMAAGTPGVGLARLQFHLDGKFVGDMGFGHDFLLWDRRF